MNKYINTHTRTHFSTCISESIVLHPKKKKKILYNTYKYTGGNTPQDTNCTATGLLSRKLFNLDDPDMQDTAGEAGMNS